MIRKKVGMDAKHSEINGSYLKRPRKPQQPWMRPTPREFLRVEKNIGVSDGMTLDHIIQEIPKGVPHQEVMFTSRYGYDEGCDTLTYTVTEPNPNYAFEMRQYERYKKEYDEKMAVYLEEKEVYDRWHKMSEEEKQAMEDKRRARLREEKIKKLEKELATLRSKGETNEQSE